MVHRLGVDPNSLGRQLGSLPSAPPPGLGSQWGSGQSSWICTPSLDLPAQVTAICGWFSFPGPALLQTSHGQAESCGPPSEHAAPSLNTLRAAYPAHSPNRHPWPGLLGTYCSSCCFRWALGAVLCPCSSSLSTSCWQITTCWRPISTWC